MIELSRTQFRPENNGLAKSGETIDHIAVIGNAEPRRCGLATFTSHVTAALGARFPGLRIDHYAMDDRSGVVYPDAIQTIDAANPIAYREAASKIEASGAQAIWVQHEFGIFGGDAGSHLLLLLERSSLPVVATLHTVLERPSEVEREVFERLLARASRLIVMAECGRKILRELYGVEDDRIAVIPHGAPDRPYVDPDSVKDRFGLAGRKVVMSFGLLAPDKGIQYMIEAMPAIVAARPDACYVVIGATHPNLVREQGEQHRQGLIDLAKRLGVSEQVKFVDAFLDEQALLEWLEACDVYVTPYLNLAQVTSGTLSFAISLGKPVVSTPYIHAREALAEDAELLVPPRDAGALAAAVGGLLADDAGRAERARRTYARGRDFLWPRMVERAMAEVEQAEAGAVHLLASNPLPAAGFAPSLDAVERMTDSTGILQHGIHSVPDRNHGYCVDDNARGLILACQIEGPAPERIGRFAGVCAAFVQHAWNPDRRSFRNFMGYDRRWLEDVGSEDSNGRSLWSLGYAAAHGRDQAMRSWAINLFDQALPLAADLGSPRALAFAVLGCAHVVESFPGHAPARALLERVGGLFQQLVTSARRPDWSWFEAVLAYDNARLPEALIRAGIALERSDYVETGLATLDWIVGIQTNSGGLFRPVGTDSFGREYVEPLPFDQQPLEAQATVDACLAALEATGDMVWGEHARTAYGWFTGENDLGQPIASRADGGCYDGLMPHGVNRNQGAESILAFQLATAAMATISAEIGFTSARDAA